MLLVVCYSLYRTFPSLTLLVVTVSSYSMYGTIIELERRTSPEDSSGAVDHGPWLTDRSTLADRRALTKPQIRGALFL